MAKPIRNPLSFSEVFDVKPEDLEELGVLDPVLTVDTKLFMDPLLLAESAHKEMNKDAVAAYKKHFSTLVTLLAGSKKFGDVGWRTALRLLHFPEIRGTCLGYGAATTRGRSWGPKVRVKVLEAAKETVELGIEDPDLFLVVALLEDGIGPDLISDMTAAVTLPALEKFNARICDKLKIKTEQFKFKDGQKASFARNPTIDNEDVPVILVPRDILRELPIVNSWDDIGQAAAENDELRGRVNELIGEIWNEKVRRKKKDQIRREIYSSKEAFEAMLDTLHAVPAKAYDLANDPSGHLAWIRARQVALDDPLKLSLAKNPSPDDVHALVRTIIGHFRELVEDKGLWKELWSGKRPRPEKSAQRIFFAISDVYCRQNDIEVSPEADSGAGPVDFKFSKGYKSRVLVEVKLSTGRVAHGYETQLETYKKAESTTRASYLVVDVGKMGSKDKKIISLKNSATQRGDPASEIEFVNAKRQSSASKR